MTTAKAESRAASCQDELRNLIEEITVVLERSKEQIFAIAEDARRECEELTQEVKRLKEAAAQQVMEVDILEKQDRQARLRLMEVSADIKSRSAAEVKMVYDEARDIRIKLQVARERELSLRRERDNLERRLKAVRETLQRAEELVSNVGFAMNVLTGRMKDLSGHIQGLSQRSNLVFSIIKAQEEERRRLARDIHDGPAQLLANVVFRVEICQQVLHRDINRAIAELEGLKTMVRESLAEVRKIIFDLRPLALDDLGLVAALRDYLNGFSEKTGLEVSMKVFGEETRFISSFEIAIFRLVQEALNNVWKHAAAKAVNIVIEFLPHSLKVAVEDNGKGFDVDAALSNQGGNRFGLIGMRERVALLGGSLEIQSEHNRGTKVQITVPIKDTRG